MARAGTSKIDFYPDEEVLELLKNLPPNTRSATLNNLVKAYFSPDPEDREDAESNLAEIIRRRNKTSKSRYAGSWVDTANRLQDVFVFMCKEHKISFTRQSARYGTVKFFQALRQFDIDPDEENLTENLVVQSAFFKTVGEMRFWQSQLAPIREDEVQFLADKWKAGHPPLHDDCMVIVEIGCDGTPQQAISQFVFEIKDHYLDKGQPFVCRWIENGEIKERHMPGN